MPNLIVIHGGGPTAVINSSLYGVICEAREHKEIDKIYAAMGGTGGLLKKALIDLTDVSNQKLELLLQSPGSAIGTSRDHLEPEDYAAMIPIFEEYDIRYVLLNGGNGTMDTCGKIYKECLEKGIFVIGIPKTMDNDIAVTDHSPGFGSAARYIAQSVAEVCADVKSMPIHVVIMETSGRNAGWITAASALANLTGDFSPDLIYLPEVAFDENKFLADVKSLIEKKKGVVVVASEGLHYADATSIVEPIFTIERSTYFGDVGAHLANLVIKKLGYKARSEKPGLLGRASIPLSSSVDRAEAILAGKTACSAAISGESGKMVGFRRVSTVPYQSETFLIDIKDVMLHEKTMPKNYINAEGNGVTEAFIDWCKPLLGNTLGEMISFVE